MANEESDRYFWSIQKIVKQFTPLTKYARDKGTYCRFNNLSALSYRCLVKVATEL